MTETEDYDKSSIPTAHKTSHQDGGTDEISVAALSGQLADAQPSTWALVSGKPTTFTPEAHKISHQDGGTDEISVPGLSGLLADAQTPLAHKTSHQDGGLDEISVAGLSGLLADDQHVLDTEAVSAMGAKANSNPLNHDRYADPEALAAAVQAGAITDAVTKAPTHDAVYDVKVMTEGHKTRHQDLGVDEISVTGLAGLLADPQTPLAHKTSHQDTGADEISVTGLSGLLADSQYPLFHKESHQDGAVDEISVTGLSGLLADAQTPLPLPKFSAHKNGVSQAVATSTWTKATFGTEVYDIGSGYDAANSRWVPGKVGYIHISAAVIWIGMPDSSRIQIAVYINGVIIKLTTFIVYTAAGYQGSLISCDIPVTSVSDYIEIFVNQEGGVDESILGSAPYSWFMGHMLV